ncbi:MAG: RimK family alpha-L-glutamate ligase [Patescibacteria group bacterium]|jgi:ribosomal protein S6--L-glutamate ligase
MHIGILTFVSAKKQIAIGTSRIIAEARARGHEVTVLYRPYIGLVFGNGKTLTYKGKVLEPKDLDVILVRPGFTEDPSVNSSIIKQFQLAGFFVLNGYIGVFRAKNKIRTLQMLDHFKVPVPKTVVVEDLALLQTAAEEFKFPVIIKAVHGTHGRGVFLAESARSLQPIVEYLTTKEHGPVTVQEYIHEAKGKDLRIFVLRKRVIAAMERTAKSGEFRANFHKGGTVSVADLTKEERLMAIKATRILGLDLAGVDILRTKHGPKVIEVNSNPGLEGISLATGIDVSKKIVDFLERCVRQKVSAKAVLHQKDMKE